MTIAYDAPDGTTRTVDLVLTTNDPATAIREGNAVIKAGMLISREGGVPSLVAGDLVFQAPNPVGGDGGIELVPPHRIANVRLTPLPPL